MGEQVAARLIWGCSSVGRAPALQAGGQEFESLHLHADNFDKQPFGRLNQRLCLHRGAGLSGQGRIFAKYP